jgi:hypothetical protein
VTIRATLWLAILAFQAATFAARAQGQEGSCDEPTGVRYVEFPAGGRAETTGRALKANDGRIVAVDVDSRIEIHFDTLCLRRYLDAGRAALSSDEKAIRLIARLDSLRAAVAGIPGAILALKETFAAFTALGAGEATSQKFEQQLRASSGKLLRIVKPLRLAIQARLSEGGLDTDAARAATAELMRPLYTGPPEGYDWAVLSELLNREIIATDAEVAAHLGKGSYALEVRAYLLDRNGHGIPLALPGHNREEEGALIPFQRFQFALSEDQEVLYERADSLAMTIDSVRSLGEGLATQLRDDFASVQERLEPLLARAAEAAKPIESQAVALTRWANPDVAKAWLQSIVSTLDKDEAGPAARAAWDDLVVALSETRADLEALQQFGALSDELHGATADKAMDAILRRANALRHLTAAGETSGSDAILLRSLNAEIWRDRIKRVDSFLRAVQTLKQPLRQQILNDPKGPVAEVRELIVALQSAATTLQGITQEGLNVIANALGLPRTLLATSLPEPKGQLRLGLTAPLDTRIQLQGIREARHENDIVSIEYRFFDGDKPLPRSWKDTFRLRVFGWRSRVVAGLAFAVQEHHDLWRPGAAVSWHFSHRGWPSGSEAGTGDPAGLGQVSFGLTTINLHFDNAQAVELGIGPSIGLFDNRLIAGGGWNLQVSQDHLYGFISLRLLNITGTN